MKNEKNKQGRKRVAMGPQGVKELTAAVEDLSKWLTEYLKGKTQYGAFSMSVLGGGACYLQKENECWGVEAGEGGEV